jgi:hypothetical protein
MKKMRSEMWIDFVQFSKYYDDATADILEKWWNDNSYPLIVQGESYEEESLAERMVAFSGFKLYRVDFSKPLTRANLLYSWNKELQNEFLDRIEKPEELPDSVVRQIIYHKRCLMYGSLAFALTYTSLPVLIQLEELDKASIDIFNSLMAEFLTNFSITIPETGQKIVKEQGGFPYVMVSQKAISKPAKLLAHPVFRNAKTINVTPIPEFLDYCFEQKS